MEELPLPGLIPGDPQNRLSVSARRRVERAHLEAERIRWEAEANIDARHLPEEKERYLRNQADLKGARVVLKVLATEFDAAGFTWREYWSAMREEIESAGNSLSLSGVQRRLLEVEFHHPPDRKPASRQNSATVAFPAKVKETIGAQIKRLRVECDLTEEDLAEVMELDIRSVQRHLASETAPRALTLRKYEKAFSKLLNKQIVIR
jgi:ribosome-binding protein aMBF1 (putative translation factor)